MKIYLLITIKNIKRVNKRFFIYGIIGAVVGLILRGVLAGVGHLDDWLFNYYNYLNWINVWNGNHDLPYFVMVPTFLCLIASFYWIYRLVKN